MHRDPQQFLQSALGGRYRVERLLGTGGTAAVYLAWDARHERQVAIKVLRPEVALALGGDRFLREIRIAARLNHPHILTLHDSGEADGLLYYVMPYVAGESVRERLTRDGQVRVEDAIRIAREVASALSHAHAQGIIHRDIKPENILLQDGMALVADFGLARALTEAKERQITETGLVMGTPAYMSPEQASGSPTVDGRTDIYALGCVLYEMLSGHPPFPGENAAMVLARHISDPVPPLRTPQHIPRDVVLAVMTALAKRPEDRFQSASQFLRALDEGGGYARRRRFRRLARGAGLALILALGGIGLFRAVPTVSTAARELFGPPPDPGAWLVLSTAAKPDSLQAAAVNGIRTALTRWQDLIVVDPAELPSRAQLGPSEELSPSEARYKAQRLGAGRLVLVEATRDADSLLVHARVLDVAVNEEIGRASAALRLGTGFRPGLAEIANRLALGVAEGEPLAPELLATRVLAAALAFRDGQRRAREWELAGADTLFSRALELDEGYPQAGIWTGMVRAWQSHEAARWRPVVERAVTSARPLAPRDSALLQGLAGMGSGDYGVACPALVGLTERPEGRGDYAAWFTAATCLARDRLVVPDRASPSGWRFRTSWQEVIRTYERALVLDPMARRAFSANGFKGLRHLMLTALTDLRYGRPAAPDTLAFMGMPERSGDTLVVTPWPSRVVEDGAPGFGGPAHRRAIQMQRERLRGMAVAWVGAEPESAEALEALAIAMDLLADPGAADTMRAARRLATTPRHRTRLAAAEAWLQLRTWFRTRDVLALRSARALADTVLAGVGRSPATPQPDAVVGLAALTGRVYLAARLELRNDEVATLPLPPAVVSSGLPLLVYAAFGGPAESLRVHARNVEAVIPRQLDEEESRLVRVNYLLRPAVLAFPSPGLEAVAGIPSGGWRLCDAQRALSRGDSAFARGVMDRSLADPARKGGIVTIDIAFSEADLLHRLGRIRDATALLDVAFEAVGYAPPQEINDAIRAATLVRAMVLRAELAREAGDAEATTRWAGAAQILWSSADDILRPRLIRVAELAGTRKGTGKPSTP